MTKPATCILTSVTNQQNVCCSTVRRSVSAGPRYLGCNNQHLNSQACCISHMTMQKDAGSGVAYSRMCQQQRAAGKAQTPRTQQDRTPRINRTCSLNLSLQPGFACSNSMRKTTQSPRSTEHVASTTQPKRCLIAELLRDLCSLEQGMSTTLGNEKENCSKHHRHLLGTLMSLKDKLDEGTDVVHFHGASSRIHFYYRPKSTRKRSDGLL